METKFDAKAYIQREYGSLVGAKIIGVRALTASELESMGWEDGWGEVGFVLMLDDGRALVPSMDPEGNGAGHLFIERWKK
jgi:hypothetical protein